MGNRNNALHAANFQKKKTIRVIYSDPDVTDSSDDEADPRCGFVRMDVNGVKRMVTKIHISDFCDGWVRSTNIGRNKPKDNLSTTSDLNVKASTSVRSSSSKHPGVRKRKWGKYACEIRNPILGNKRQWLGTYDTEEQAIIAYQAKKREINALLELEKRRNPSTPSAVATSNVCKHGYRKKKHKMDSPVDSEKGKYDFVVPASSVATSDAVASTVCLLEAATLAVSVSASVAVASSVAESKNKNVNFMGNQPSPASVLDTSVANTVANEPVALIKEDDSQTTEPNTLSEVPSMNRELNIRNEPRATSFFGSDFEYFFGELWVDDLSMCDLCGVGLCDLPNCDFDITNRLSCRR